MGIVDLRPNSVRTIDELISALKAKAEITPKGEWVRGKRYEDTKLGRSPTRFDLDQATTDHPVRTMGGAFASFDDKIKGSITEGKLADFVLLSEDPRETPSDSIKDILVEKTYIDGKLVFEI